MTEMYDTRSEFVDAPAISGAEEPKKGAEDLARRKASLNERMTNAEVAIGLSLWKHAKVKIPRSALQRVALDLFEHSGKRQLLSQYTYGEFYSGQVGVPADIKPFEEGPDDYKDASEV